MDAPYAGWSALPGRIPPVEPPRVTGPTCPLLPVSCGTCATGRCVVPAQQPVVPVPVYQEIQRKDRIVEVPQTIVTDKIIPKLYHQQIVYEVPKLSLQFREKIVRIPRVEFRQKIIEIPVPVGYNYKVVSKWNIREVPKVIPKYIGPQKDLYVEVPQVKIMDKTIEKEVPVYVGEKIVRKEVIEEEPVEVVQYRYVEKEEEVPVYKYKPVFDVEVDIPPPLIVPVPVKPKEVRLEPERLTLEQWKKLRMGGTSACCNENASCGPNPPNPNCCNCGGKNSCTLCCQPGGLFSPTGLCGTVCGKGICECCRGTGCSACCAPDTGATQFP